MKKLSALPMRLMRMASIIAILLHVPCAWSLSLALPSDITVSTTGILTPVTYPLPADSNDVRFIYDPPSGSEFPVGESIVRVTGIDSFGRSSEYHFTVTVCNGDLNGDEVISPADALIAFKCYLVSGPCPKCADVNQDGHITPADALCLFQSYVGQASCLEIEEEQLSVTYGFTAEATYVNIRIDQAKLVYTYFEDTDQKCRYWVAQSPCWTQQDLTTMETPLSKDEVNGLIGLIYQTRFVDLEDTYGGAAPGQRYYPYTLSVRITQGEQPVQREKTVVYQSFPTSSPRPEAFQVIESRLLELVRQKFPMPGKL
ncbi:MAG: dockerin type I domain-containing protein [bacterium]